jgi:HEAT repeat protein
LQDLGHLLAKPDLNPVLRWLVVDQLAENPAAGSLLLNSLEQAVLDPFTRGKLALSLGRRNMLAALPVLRRLAEQRDGDGYVRMCATEALGMITDPAVETTLLHIIADVTAAPALRGTAAEALPATIGEEIRRWLNELLRRERQPAELVVGALRALSRTSDAEVPGLLLQYVQSDQPAIAIAAMTGLRALDDQRVVPTLTRLAQNPTIDQRVRLHAVATLLHFSETDYLPLLRSFLDGGILTFQLQALDCLLNARPADSRPLQLLADKSVPLALRQRSLEALRQRPNNHGVLCRLVADGGEDTHLRVTAAAILAESPHPDAIATLERYARESSAPLRLRRQCIEALEQHARRDSSEILDARYMLGKLAADPTLPAESHMWAASALVELL